MTGDFEMGGKSIVFWGIRRLQGRSFGRMLWLRPIFLFLTSIGGRPYGRFTMDGLDSELSGREDGAPKKTKLLSLHTGFNVHSLVRAKTRVEAEPVGKYMIRPLLSLERLSLDEKQGLVCYRYGKGAGELETMDYLELIARVTSHIPDKGQVMVRYYGLYANAHRGKIKKASLAAFPLWIVEDKLQPIPSRGWAEMIRKVYEVDPMLCPQCGGTMKVIAFLSDFSVVDRIINHLKLTFVAERPPPPRVVYQELLMAAETPAEYFS